MKKLLMIATIVGSLFAMEADIFRYQLLADRFETNKDGDKSWDINFYVGYDIDKLYIYSEGENSESQNEIVYSHAVTPFWDMQIGYQKDMNGAKSKEWAVVGIQGLAPYFIETRTKLLVSNNVVGIDFDFEYETLFTQRLILNSRIESTLYSDNIPQIEVGKGLSNIELGFRLRYEIRREFAPYIGFSYSQNFGNTKSYRGKNESSLIWGVRFWF